jgi:dihydrolipoamide dehydrogenase
MTARYDVAIIGAGPGGYTAALRAAQRGASVVLIDKSHPGGTCLNAGCIPTKALLHASAMAFSPAAAKRAGIEFAAPTIDGEAVMARVAKIVAGLRKGVHQLLKARKVTFLVGSARLTGPDVIVVDSNEGDLAIEANRIIVATGASPVRPGWASWGSPRIMTTDEAMTASVLPESIIIIGGGVIGCELATAYAELGIETHLVELTPALLPGLDADISNIVTRSLKKRKVQLYVGTGVDSLAGAEEAVTATLSGGQVLTASHALVAIGRQANIGGLGLETLGVNIADGRIVVDEQCRTSVEGLYAVGDVACSKHYAHVASRMGLIAAMGATDGELADELSLVPECIYTHPEAAAVGYTQADDAAIAVRQVPISACGIAQAYGEIDGMVKLFIDTASRQIRGGVIIAPHATELISTITLAIRQGLTVEAFANLVWPHPTFAESLGEAAEAYLGYPLHVLE